MNIKEQADLMLAESGILDILDSFGQSYLHGSHDLDLMVWPELDIGMQVEDLNQQIPFDVMSALSRVVCPTVAMAYNQFGRPNRFRMGVDESILVDFRFEHRDLHWKLDILMVANDEGKLFPRYNAKIKESLTQENREIVHAIKRRVFASQQYRKSRWVFTDSQRYFSAHDIYRAVFAFGVKDVQEFADYLLKHRGIRIGLPPQSLYDSFSIVAK